MCGRVTAAGLRVGHALPRDPPAPAGRDEAVQHPPGPLRVHETQQVRPAARRRLRRDGRRGAVLRRTHLAHERDADLRLGPPEGLREVVRSQPRQVRRLLARRPDRRHALGLDVLCSVCLDDRPGVPRIWGRAPLGGMYVAFFVLSEVPIHARFLGRRHTSSDLSERSSFWLFASETARRSFFKPWTLTPTTGPSTIERFARRTTRSRRPWSRSKTSPSAAASARPWRATGSKTARSSRRSTKRRNSSGRT
mmetsp:Transcript_14130/g.46125  ORF Transcript_14130/g.46125 Transcript_14130/m.46125 type:complete len:251 (-) Transcript_14130:538-1290(-)